MPRFTRVLAVLALAGLVPLLPVPREGPAALATWPWAEARSTSLSAGLVLTEVHDAGTGVFLFEADPRLRLGLYDADEDDPRPRDGVVARRTAEGEVPTAVWAWGRLAHREVRAVFNGPFFGLGAGTLFPTAPGATGDLVYYGSRSPRWALACRAGDLALLHRPSAVQMAGMDWASGNVQALVVGGEPTRLAPPTRSAPGRRSPPSQPGDCGPYPWIDHLKVARTSLGWKEGRLAVLVVTQAAPESEATSFLLRHLRLPQRSGWDLADLQRFWRAWGAEGACNLDGGLSTQACFSAKGRLHVLWSNSPGPERVDGREGWPVLQFPYLFEDG